MNMASISRVQADHRSLFHAVNFLLGMNFRSWVCHSIRMGDYAKVWRVGSSTITCTNWRITVAVRGGESVCKLALDPRKGGTIFLHASRDNDLFIFVHSPSDATQPSSVRFLQLRKTY